MSGVLLEDHKLTRTVFKHITAIPLSSLPPTEGRVRASFILQQLQIHLPTKTPGRQPLKLLRRKRTGRIHTEANSNKLRKTCPISTISVRRCFSAQISPSYQETRWYLVLHVKGTNVNFVDALSRWGPTSKGCSAVGGAGVGGGGIYTNMTLQLFTPQTLCGAITTHVQTYTATSRTPHSSKWNFDWGRTAASGIR